MALCHNCDDTRIEYIGNGSQTDYTFPFEYYKKEDVAVANWNEEYQVWVPVSSNDWVFQNDTKIRFDKAPANGQKFIIYRCTDLTPLPAEFHPGHSIKAQDLNDNFFVLQSAIEETRCSIAKLDEKAEEKYWNKIPFEENPDPDNPDKGETVYSDQEWVCSDEAVASTQAICDKIEEEIDLLKVTEGDNKAGDWTRDSDLNSDDYFPTTAAVTDRLDPFFQEDLPIAPSIWRMPGKLWFDNDDVTARVWDQANQVWIQSGLAGPPGPPGPIGTYATIVSDDAPTRRLDNTDLVNGDVWFNSNTATLYVWYDDGKPENSTRSKQWVNAVAAAGPQGPPGDDGEDGEDGDEGPQGNAGPAGHVIVSDTPPTEYPALGQNASRDLEAGDLWFDSLQVLLYVYYLDDVGPGQWVSISKTGPQGEAGEPGEDGAPGADGITDAPTDGKLYGRQDGAWEEVQSELTFDAPLVQTNNKVQFVWSSLPSLI